MRLQGFDIHAGLTKKFYDTMMKFCFPERDTDNIDPDGSEDSESTGSSTNLATKKNKFSSSNEKSKKSKDTNFYVPIMNDVEKMKVNDNTASILAGLFLFYDFSHFRNERRRINYLSISKFRKFPYE